MQVDLGDAAEGQGLCFEFSTPDTPLGCVDPTLVFLSYVGAFWGGSTGSREYTLAWSPAYFRVWVGPCRVMK